MESGKSIPKVTLRMARTDCKAKGGGKVAGNAKDCAELSGGDGQPDLICPIGPVFLPFSEKHEFMHN